MAQLAASRPAAAALYRAHRTSRFALSGTYGLIILDEINYVLGYGYISVDEVICTLQSRPPHVHVVLTGRNAPDEIISIADCVTEMRDIKHPYRAGVPAQKGIDF